MKKLFILTVALALVIPATAQSVRLIGHHFTRIEGMPVPMIDSAVYIYSAGNTSMGNFSDYEKGILKPDTIVNWGYNSLSGYFLKGRKIIFYNRLISVAAFFPSVINKTYNNKWGSSEIKNSGIHSFGSFFAELLCCFSAD